MSMTDTAKEDLTSQKTQADEMAGLEPQWVDIEVAIHTALISKHEAVRETSLQHFVKTIESTLKGHVTTSRERLEAVENLIKAFSA
jgi:hypothetical protein